MGFPTRDMTKAFVGKNVAAFAPQARYSRMILVLSHMRSATTALSNVLCSHPAISGYGETHVTHTEANSPGQVLVNVARRRAYEPRAKFLFDKVLHDHLDVKAPQAFADARAIFLVRAPGPAVASIVKLAAATSLQEVREPGQAALYYANRLESLAQRWQTFSPERRFGLTAERLLDDPDSVVDQIGNWLDLSPQLENRYVSHKATQLGGGGDPTASARLSKIEARPSAAPSPVVGVDAYLNKRCQSAYGVLVAAFEQSEPPVSR
ncbi:sulfotransferase family protein [Sulfitobacter sp. SK012]|uniref:sulfotransferase family protein n=1 Tax=Sulfitobacter sp. SK012 TaxID=1389005 RepID=UPI000E0ACC6E|nr:sulfotransferase [Sulfitobacter sp. SK012]AXI46690.1 sulfotransferase family protein [Sulfitobacter sp. SK012]